MDIEDKLDFKEFKKTIKQYKAREEEKVILNINVVLDLINKIDEQQTELEKKEKELEEAKRETQQVLDDYQDLGKEKYKLECEEEKKDKKLHSLEWDLRKIKRDLDFEPWSIYRVEGNILFDMAQQIENKVEKEGK